MSRNRVSRERERESESHKRSVNLERAQKSLKSPRKQTFKFIFARENQKSTTESRKVVLEPFTEGLLKASLITVLLLKQLKDDNSIPC